MGRQQKNVSFAVRPLAGVAWFRADARFRRIAAVTRGALQI
jgi:hypothetical protein